MYDIRTTKLLYKMVSLMRSPKNVELTYLPLNHLGQGITCRNRGENQYCEVEQWKRCMRGERGGEIQRKRESRHEASKVGVLQMQLSKQRWEVKGFRRIGMRSQYTELDTATSRVRWASQRINLVNFYPFFRCPKLLAYGNSGSRLYVDCLWLWTRNCLLLRNLNLF